MALRNTFNTDPETYDAIRPTYTEGLFDRIIAYSGLNKECFSLEVGVGTGQATGPILKTGCDVTAIELGDQLANYVDSKFSDYDNFRVINKDFESVQLVEGSYDLVYAASAFHWIDPSVGLPKVLRLLKSGGSFAWITLIAMPSAKDLHIHNELQSVYKDYSKYFPQAGTAKGPAIRKQMADRKRAEIMALLTKYAFEDIKGELYYTQRTFTGSDYVKLISTFSDHKVMPDVDRVPFLKRIEDIIERHGGEFTLDDQILLCMGKKG